jgi:hypothetical protein
MRCRLLLPCPDQGVSNPFDIAQGIDEYARAFAELNHKSDAFANEFRHKLAGATLAWAGVGGMSLS